MPSPPIDTGWGFNAVIDLLESDYNAAPPTPAIACPGRVALESTPRPVAQSTLDVHSPRLGDFTKLFHELGLASLEPLATCSPTDSESPLSSDDVFLDGHTDTSSIGDPGSLRSKELKKERKRVAKKERKEARRTLRASLVPDITSSSAQPLMGPPPPRSNVGAKIRQANPSSIETPPPAPKLQPPSRTLDFSNPSTGTPSLSVSSQQPISLAQPFAPAFTLLLGPTLQQGPVNGSTNATTRQPLMRASLYEKIPSHGPQPHTSSSVRALVPRTVMSAGASGLHSVSPGRTPASPTPIRTATPRAGTMVDQVPAVEPISGLATNTVGPALYQLQSPNQPTPSAQLPFTHLLRPAGLTIRSRLDRHFHFLNQLLANFPEDHQHLLAPMVLNTEEAKAQGIHCFVDASNIMIGFKNMLRERGANHQQFEMSFDSLALLMERRRPVAKRIYASSHREAKPLPHVTRLAETSKAVGYENLVKEQVFIRREDSQRKKFFKDVDRLGWDKALLMHGSGSDSETGAAAATGGAAATLSAPKWVEQGVDEILHLKMCQSVLDTEVPTTMVLATGDGNAAEHSDGFLANVERALKRGWTVELVSWKQQMSAGYRNKKWRAKWGDRFKIVELDEYLESLIET